ncbi:MAG: tellurite resistance TerB family protein [Anaerolineales bacterium]
MSDSNVIMALAKVMIATAWADGSITNDEINCLKDLLFQMPEMTARDWDALDIYIESPVGEAERQRLLGELVSNLRSDRDKALAMSAIDSMVKADGSLPEDERKAMEEIREAIQDANMGVFGNLGKLLGGSMRRRSQALADAPNRELYLDDYTKNRVYYEVSRRLELEGGSIDLPEEELRKLSLAGGLMARVAYVDGDVNEGEMDTMVQAIQEHWHLADVQAALVAEVAVSQVSKGMDYYRLSRRFFEKTNEDERVRFLDVLFAVAAGDGYVSYEETEEIRTIATVEKLTHKQFIDAKLKVPHDKRVD